MHAPVYDINRMNYTTRLAWFLMIIFLLFGLGVLRNVIVFILTKLYEIFIQQNPVRI